MNSGSRAVPRAPSRISSRRGFWLAGVLGLGYRAPGCCIKSFRPEPEGDSSARIGKEAISTLANLSENQKLRVQLAEPPKDVHGRTLATLYASGEDLGMELVERGLALVYTVHPFPAMSTYLQQQHAARAEHRGLWADAELGKRAELLVREWEQAEP
jgi:micrococcal nuclease